MTGANIEMLISNYIYCPLHLRIKLIKILVVYIVLHST